MHAHIANVKAEKSLGISTFSPRRTVIKHNEGEKSLNLHCAISLRIDHS